MIAVERAKGERSYEVKRWEFHTLMIEIVLLGGLAMGSIAKLAPKVLQKVLPLPGEGWMLAGFLLLGMALYPALRIESRNVHGRELGFGRWLVALLVAGVVGALLFALVP